MGSIPIRPNKPFAVEQVQKVWQKPYKNVGIMFGATFLKGWKKVVLV